MNHTGVTTILVVDDDPSILRLTTTLLERHGYRVIPARSASQGLECFDRCRNQLNLILSDVVMPSMSGTEMIERILTLDPSMPVLFMTGYSAERSLPESVPVLAKPFTAAMLVESIRQCLGAPPVCPPVTH